ncbi:MAG: hypothetical protein NVS2B7_30450 [Herpetosiphon sp.]
MLELDDFRISDARRITTTCDAVLVPQRFHTVGLHYLWWLVYYESKSGWW